MLEKAAAAKEEVDDKIIILITILINHWIMYSQAVARLKQQDSELRKIRDGLVARSKVCFKIIQFENKHISYICTQKPVTLTPRNKEKVWKQVLDIIRPRKHLGIEVGEIVAYPMCLSTASPGER